jgi:5-methylcytosine-specific restriction endonuclease McrA
MPDIEASLREFVRLRAAGLCEYCGISERLTLAEHEIDHVIAMKHGGQSVVENLALCCAVCNRFKGSDIASIDPGTGDLTPLYHPRLDRWDDHYELRNGEITGLTATGRATVRLLRMNRPTRIKERQLLAALKPS